MTETPTQYQLEGDQPPDLQKMILDSYESVIGEMMMNPYGGLVFGSRECKKRLNGKTLTESDLIRFLVIEYIDGDKETRKRIEAWLQTFPVLGRMAIAYLRYILAEEMRRTELGQQKLREEDAALALARGAKHE